MTLESALIPIPSEATMTFSGFLASTGVLNFWLIVMVGTFANLFGSLLAYGLGNMGERQVLSFIRKYGHFVLIREREYGHAQKLFNKHGELIVFLSRVLPAIRTYISLPAGIAKMNIQKFVIYTFAGCLLWSIILTYLGFVLGSNWHRVTPFFHFLDVLIILGVLAGIGLFLYKKLRS